MKMKNFRWLLILLLITGNMISCGPRDRAQSQSSQAESGNPTNQEAPETQAESGNPTNQEAPETQAESGNPTNQEAPETQAESGNPTNQEAPETQNTDGSEEEGSKNLLSVFNLLIVILLSVGGFVGYTQLKSWIDTERKKSHDFRKRSSETINELNRNVQNLAFQTQGLKEQFKELKKQISSNNSKSSFSSSRSQDKQQYQIGDEINYPVYSQPAPVVQRDPYQEVITAFNAQDTNFFRQNIYYLALDESTVGGETSAGARRIVKFVDIDNPRDALCLAINVNFEYLLVPNFFSPYYASLDQWLFENNDIFNYQGHGQTIELVKPGKVQYSQSGNGIWNLMEPVRLQLI
ncbi:hypothetical protein FEK30_15940 (plasmid) [Picosynechococcus sp. PCC 11901]|uniref:hypothetical protein n=1 Tax=Picosynechococcus sp. PCC 11901 TaxID=2579791 RepID=UPI0010FC07F1|nr:hypothetical protein [Picosynechococcus sp. PCC 11901]QCS51008.1 hypothetical protein FEK30_15940 [Picosynechococcus sp. PCC 11901]